METMQEVAEAGVTAQAQIDKHLTVAHKAAVKNTKVTIAGIQMGMVRALRGKKLLAQCRELEGMIAAAARLAAEIHIEQAKVCEEQGVDTGSLATVGGVTVGGMTTMGGGGR